MKTTNETSERALTILGTVMMIAWFVIIGIGGFLLALAAFYALAGSNLTLLVVTCLCLPVPLTLTLIWGFSALDHWVRGPKPQEERSDARVLDARAAHLA